MFIYLRKEDTLMTRILSKFLLVLGLAVTLEVYAAGLLTPTDGSLPELQIRSHRVEVVIEDGYAVTRVDQVFHNPHARDLEARYSFPVPEQGSVAELTLWIDGRPMQGEVVERARARKIYKEEKTAGRDAALTEKDAYKTFEVMVSPVRAGQDTRIRLAYMQPAHIDHGIGRYVYPLEEGGVDDAKLAFWTADSQVEEHFSFDLKLRSAYPVDAVRAPNQGQAQIIRHGPGAWQLSLSNQATPSAAQHPATADESAPLTIGVDENGTPVVAFTPPAEGGAPSASNIRQAAYMLDQDIAVYWRHQPGLPGTVDLVAYRPDPARPGTFMLVLTPGDDLQSLQQGRDWMFVLDLSGSMKGKYAALAEGVHKALEQLRAGDRFRIVMFNERAWELTSGYVDATPEQVRRYRAEVARQQPGSSTNLYAGLELGLNNLDADRTGGVVLVTDGVANMGETRQRKFLELLQTRDVRLFTFIMGNSANRPLLEALTKASNGFALSISNTDDIVGRILQAVSKVTHQAMHGLKLDLDGIGVSDLTPRRMGSLYRGRQLVLFGHYSRSGPAQVKLSGTIGGRPKVYATQFEFPAQADENPELERLWAYANIEDIMHEMEDFGETSELRQAVVDLGVQYGLVTDYTSMLVVRDEVFQRHGIERHNRERVATEYAAQKQRSRRPAQSRRADGNKPMFPGFRSGLGGGGSLDFWYLLLLLPLLAMRLRRGVRV